MKINKFSRQKTGLYKVLLEDDSYILIHEDLILKYDLLLTKEIDDELKEKLLKENLNYLAYDTAIKYLSNKMRSTYELKQFLKKKEIDEDIINDVVDRLKKVGYLDDNIYCKAYINDKINLSNDGPKKVINGLKEMKIKDNIIQDNIKIYTSELETEKVEKLVNKKIKSNHNKGSYLLKQNIHKYLIDLGYDNSIINSVLNSTKIDDKDIYQKEYDKLYKKYSNKYEGKELEYIIKNKLYQKGFSNNE